VLLRRHRTISMRTCDVAGTCTWRHGVWQHARALAGRDGRACGAQALICSALALPPTFFRRLVQSNGASSVLDFLPARGGAGGAPTLVVDRLNQARRSAPRARPSAFLVRPSIRRHRSCEVHCTAQARLAAC